jgi:hypothetical protein
LSEVECILTDVDDLNTLVQRVLHAQSHNSALQGDDLTVATKDLARIAGEHSDSELVAADAAGDRIIGAATVLHPALNAPADLTRRLDGRSVLLVSGVVAGAVGLMQTAARLRSLGATAVHAAILNGWDEAIPGMDELVSLGGPDHRGVPGGSVPGERVPARTETIREVPRRIDDGISARSA